MKKKKIDYNKEIPFIRRRCPHLKGQELLDAEERFRDYVRICLDIYDRIKEQRRMKNFDKNSNEFYNDDELNL